MKRGFGDGGEGRSNAKLASLPARRSSVHTYVNYQLSPWRNAEFDGMAGKPGKPGSPATLLLTTCLRASTWYYLRSTVHARLLLLALAVRVRVFVKRAGETRPRPHRSADICRKTLAGCGPTNTIWEIK